jgi:hypothetical protein
MTNIDIIVGWLQHVEKNHNSHNIYNDYFAWY